MKPLRMFLALVVLAGAASLASAADRTRVTPTPIPLSYTVKSVPAPERVQACAPYYDDTVNQTDYYFAGTVEMQDDLHMIGPGHLCAVDFGYVNPTTTATTVTLTFYANDAEDMMSPSVVLAGPYVLSDLPAYGKYLVHADLETGAGPPDLTQDIWLGIAFSPADVGVVLAHPPTLGSSHDLFAMQGGYYWFGGDPVANFALGVTANELPTPAAPATWGRLKQLYR